MGGSTPSGPIWALVAIRGLEGKKRLESLLAPDERRALILAMADDVLSALAPISALAGVALTTADPELGPLARRHGVQLIIDDESPGLNEAVAHAARILARQGAQSLLVLPGDVPMVQPSDIDAMLAAQPAGVTVARAASDGGTNALLLSPWDAIGFHFGKDSCAAHEKAAVDLGIPVLVIDLSGLALDIDYPDDIRILTEQPGDGKAATLVRNLLGRDGRGRASAGAS